MAQADTGDGDQEQCRALTADGERCSRPAQDDGFCYQHDESDPTIDEAEGDDQPESADEDAGESTDESDSTGGSDAESTADGETEPSDDTSESEDTDMAAESEQADEGDEQAEGADVKGAGIDLWQARETARRVAESYIDDPFDGVIEIERTDDEDADGDWTVVVEVIERNSIPDTQDILGRYEITLDGGGDVTGYRLTGRYRRGDVSDEQAPEQ